MRSTSRPCYPPPIILPAVRADIPELARVGGCRGAQCAPSAPESMREKNIKHIIEVLDENFDAPQLLIMKALDADTKQITALAIWQLQFYDPKGVSDSHAASSLFRTQSLNAGVLLSGIQGEPQSGLSDYIQSQFSACLNSWTRDIKHISLAILMTGPRFQRRGIGGAMVNWGHGRTDRDGVPAVLIASPVGHPLYQSLGWKEVSTPMQIDLRDWVKYAEKGDMGWGTYKFYFMLRLPKTGGVRR